MAVVVIKQLHGRSSRYSDETAAEICRRISLGQSLVSVTNDPAMPSETTVIRWLSDDRYSEFRALYVRAREQQVERFVDEIVDIADRVAGSADSAVVHAARLAIDTRKWAAAKRLPKKYGDRLGVDSSGSLTIKILHGLGDEPDGV
jgi:hypothetical protein